MQKEAALANRIMLEVQRDLPVTLWKNTTGSLWAGAPVSFEAGEVVLKGARRIQAGLCVGSADLIGIHHRTGRFIALEVKTDEGRASKEQRNFLAHVRGAGGIAGIVRSPQQAVELIEEQQEEHG